MEPLKMLDLVALLIPKTELRLQIGQVGTVVEILHSDYYEIEFCDKEGRSIAICPVHRNDLLHLQYDNVLS